VNKVVAATTSVSSTEIFPTMGLALQLEVPTAAASIPRPKVREECWNSGPRWPTGGDGSQYPPRGGGGQLYAGGGGGGGHIEGYPATGDPPHGIMGVGPI
jgi:hypothetical protein